MIRFCGGAFYVVFEFDVSFVWLIFDVNFRLDFVYLVDLRFDLFDANQVRNIGVVFVFSRFSVVCLIEDGYVFGLDEDIDLIGYVDCFGRVCIFLRGCFVLNKGGVEVGSLIVILGSR